MLHWISALLLRISVAVLALFPCTELAAAGDLYLHLIWHQHQPLYVDPATDQLRGPWVRTHATKDYYDMAALHREFPEVHATINLTSSLLHQLENYYVNRMQPYVYRHADGQWAVHAEEFLAHWGGKTDPWIDLALRPSEEFTDTDKAMLLTEPWNAFGISDIQIARFPEYAALRTKAKTDSLSAAELTAVKAWFFLGHFDPDFLRGHAALDVDLSDLVTEDAEVFRLLRPLTERDASRLVADAVRVMAAVVPEHRTLRTAGGQVEIITTPFYHPILPLLIDSDVARICQPRDSLPTRFAFPRDAAAQVRKGKHYYEQMFGSTSSGMWPAEGAISAAAAAEFAKAGIRWICGDMQVLAKSQPSGLPVAQPYRLQTAHGDIIIVFRETNLSDHIGFTYQNMHPDSAIRHFVSAVSKFRPTADEPDRLLTVILDGENAWEWYERDMDAKRFLRGLYQAFSTAREQGEFTCVTLDEYLDGNSVRGIPPHLVESLTAIDTLWPGSWIAANFDTWIGEAEENRAWEYLLQARRDLEASGLPRPEPVDTSGTLPEAAARAGLNDKQWTAVGQAYEAMYAAEGSDWFWWYGADQTAPGGELPFQDAFFNHLRSVYRHLRSAGVEIATPEFPSILSPTKQIRQGGGVMAPGERVVAIVFVCDATAQDVADAIYIAGNLPELGSWIPNTVRMYDDATHGDAAAGDGHWSLQIEIPAGTEVQFKYTNSGVPGNWVPAEEFPFRNRSVTVADSGGGTQVVSGVFGQ